MEDIINFLSAKQNLSTSTNLGGQDNPIPCQEFENGEMGENLKSVQSGRWTVEEQVLYLKFIESQRIWLADKEGRRSSKIFKMMSRFISSRGPDQCRSHHQKMQKKYDSISRIIQNCRNSLSQIIIDSLAPKPITPNTDSEDRKEQSPFPPDTIDESLEMVPFQLQELEPTNSCYDKKDYGIFSELQHPAAQDLFQINSSCFQLLL